MFHSFKILAILFFFSEPDERNVRTVRHALKRMKFIELVGCARHTADMRTPAGIRRIIGPINQCCVPVKLKNELETLACLEKLSGNHLDLYTQNASAYAVRITCKVSSWEEQYSSFSAWASCMVPHVNTRTPDHFPAILLQYSSLFFITATSRTYLWIHQHTFAIQKCNSTTSNTAQHCAIRAMCRLDFSDTAQLSATGCSESTMHALRLWQWTS